MSDQQLIKKQSSKIMRRTAVLMISVFTIFITLLTICLNLIWYVQVDRLLKTEQQDILADTAGGIERLLLPKTILRLDNVNEMPSDSLFSENKKLPITDLNLFTQSMGGHMIEAVYNTEGNLVNEKLLSEREIHIIKQEFPLNLIHFNEVIEFKNNHGNTYRTLIFKVVLPDENTIYYVQLILDVTNETKLLSTYTIMVVLCGIVLVLIAIVSSRHIARNAMKPIIEGWKKQSEFIGNASHELRTPLAIIQSKQEQLLTKPFDQIIAHAENISITLNETKRLTKLTSDLLTLSKSESGENHLQYERFDLIPILQEIQMVYNEVAQMQNKTLHINAPDKLEIIADKARIHQLIIILLDNALKYTEPKDRIDINAQLSLNYQFIIEVVDTGVGVSSENLHRLTERFFREDKARSRASGGTGLGLSIASWIVETHQGSLIPRHNIPRGMIFSVTLPMKKLKEYKSEK